MPEIIGTQQLQKTGFANHLSDFFSELDVTEQSKRTYKRNIKQFVLWMVSNRIASPTPADILNYKNDLLQRVSPATATAYIQTIKMFFKWLTEKGVCSQDPCRKIKLPKRTRGFKKDTLANEDIYRLLNSTTSLRDRAILYLMLFTALRTIEIVRSNIEDLRSEGGQSILSVFGKGHSSADDIVVISPVVKMNLQAYLKTRKGLKAGQPLFVSEGNRNAGGRLTTFALSHLVKSYLRKIDLNNPKLSAHSLRHSAISACLKSGATIQEACSLARHKNLDTTLIYAHNLERISNDAPEHKLSKYFVRIFAKMSA